MKLDITNQKFLLFIALYSACVTPVYFFAPGIIAAVLLFPFFLFFPGYSLLALLLPRKNDFSRLARVTAGIGISIGLVTLIALALFFSPWKINPTSVFVASLIFIFIFTSAAIFRDRGIPATDRPRLYLKLPVLSNLFKGSRLEIILSALLGTVILFTIGVLAFSMVSPPQGEQFTEFYLLPSGEAQDKYTSQVIAGQPLIIKVVVVNREQHHEKYRIDIYLNSKMIGQQKSAELNYNEKWETPLDVSVDSPGPNQQLEMYLYKADSAIPLIKEPLSLIINGAAGSQNK